MVKKYLVKNIYHGSVELVCGEEIIFIHEGKTIILSETQMETIPEHKKYLFDGFLTTSELKDDIQKTTKK